MYSKITKTIFAGIVLACASTAVNAQTVNKFGANSMTIAPSAVLELESTTKGFLAPRMKLSDRTAIVSPATGLLVYQTDGTTGFYSYDGTSWLLNAVEGKLALPSTNVFVGNASGLATAVALSGDAAITNAGVLTVANSAITAAKIAANSVTLAKLSPTIAGTAGQVLATDGTGLAWATPFTNTLNTANLFIGNASNIATGVALSGDATITNAGALTIANNAVTTVKILNASVTTDKIADANITLAKLSATGGTTGQVLSTNGTVLSWATPFTNTLASANVFVGNGTNVATGVALSGDATITTAGALTIGNNAVTTVKILDVNVTTPKIAANAVTYAKMQAVTANRLLGSGLTGTAVAELTLGTGLSFTGTTINAVSNNIASVLTVNAATTLTAANNSVYTSTAMTITLPVPGAENTGLTFLIKKTDNDTTLTFSQSIFTTATDSFTTLNYAKAIRIQSNGTNWYLVN